MDTQTEIVEPPKEELCWVCGTPLVETSEPIEYFGHLLHEACEVHFL